jgi:class 3 adenylate cyclase
MGELVASLRSAVRARGGREVGGPGDGIIAAFASARDAVACAIEMQRSHARDARRANGGLAVRVGLHVGQLIGDADEEAYGSVVVITRRLCAKARGGQILASTLVRDGCAQSGEHHFGDPFEIVLEGLATPQPGCEVR